MFRFLGKNMARKHQQMYIKHNEDTADQQQSLF